MSEYQSNPNIGIYFSASIVLMVVLLVIGLATDINSILVYVFFIITSFSAPSIIFIDDKDIKIFASILFIVIYAFIFGLGFVEGENYTESERIHPDKYTQVKTPEMVAIFYKDTVFISSDTFSVKDGVKLCKISHYNYYNLISSTSYKMIKQKEFCNRLFQ